MRDHAHTKRRTCRAPGCRRAARRCQLDHTQDWALHGITADDNLEPLCEYHHKMKNFGWTYRVEETGHITWTAPTRHQYTVDPEPVLGDPPPF